MCRVRRLRWNPTLVSSLTTLTTHARTHILSSPSSMDSSTPKHTSTETVWNTIAASVHDTSLPPLARLHCTGILTTARHLLSSPNQNPQTLHQTTPTNQTQTQTQTPLSSTVLPHLHQAIADTPLAHPARIHDASAAISLAERTLTKEAEDETMEREIIRAATVKGEGARDIARRQKGKREDRKVAEREGRSKPAVGGGGDDTMEEDG